MKNNWKILNYFELVKYILLDNYESEMNQIYMTDIKKPVTLYFNHF